jgi:hypothetical protein
MNCSQLDSIRADYMAAFLNPEEAERSIWRFDVTPREHALADAIDRQSYDDIAAADKNPAAKFAITGPGIEDTYFTSLPEFFSALHWIVFEHFRGCLAENHYENSRAYTAARREKNDYLTPIES